MKTQQSQKKKKTVTLSEQSQTLRNEITRKANPEKQSADLWSTQDVGREEMGGDYLRYKRASRVRKVVKLEKDGGCTAL